MIASLVDTEALWHAALYAFVGSMAFVGSFGLAIFARDRAAREGPAPRERAAAWNVLLGVALIGCVAIMAVGVWAMAQKS